MAGQSLDRMALNCIGSWLKKTAAIKLAENGGHRFEMITIYHTVLFNFNKLDCWSYRWNQLVHQALAATCNTFAVFVPHFGWWQIGSKSPPKWTLKIYFIPCIGNSSNGNYSQYYIYFIYRYVRNLKDTEFIGKSKGEIQNPYRFLKWRLPFTYTGSVTIPIGAM